MINKIMLISKKVRKKIQLARHVTTKSSRLVLKRAQIVSTIVSTYAEVCRPLWPQRIFAKENE